MLTFIQLILVLGVLGAVQAQGHPDGYDRCDLTFCTGRSAGNYQVSPCSKYYCSCTPTATVKFSTQACSTTTPPQFYEKSAGCQTAAVYSECKDLTAATHTASPLPAPPASETQYCSPTNCADRHGQAGFFALALCTPDYCVCNFAANTQSVKQCAVNQFFDFRPEFFACRNATLLQFCGQGLQTTTTSTTTTTTTTNPGFTVTYPSDASVCPPSSPVSTNFADITFNNAVSPVTCADVTKNFGSENVTFHIAVDGSDGSIGASASDSSSFGPDAELVAFSCADSRPTTFPFTINITAQNYASCHSWF